MKKLAWICITAMTVSSFVACGVKDRSQMAARLAKTKDKNTAEENKALAACTPGRAGSVTLSGGALVVDNNGKKELSPDVIVQQVDGSKAAVAQNQNTPNSNDKSARDNKMQNNSNQSADNIRGNPSFTTLSESTRKILADLEKEETFLSLGCDNKNIIPTDVSSHWTPVTADKIKSGQTLKVGTLYVCGDQARSEEYLTINANSVVMVEGRLMLKDVKTGLLVVNTNHLSISTKGQFAATTKDSLEVASEGAAVQINANVMTLTNGAKLTVLTKGGSCALPSAADNNQNSNQSTENPAPDEDGHTAQEEKANTKKSKSTAKSDSVTFDLNGDTTP